MTIKEIEERTGLERANIRFYEKEGLLMPDRLENGYRSYTEKDVQTLLRIKLLRSLQLSLEDIRALQKGEKQLSEALSAHLHTLEKEKQALAAAEDVCRMMETDNARFETLNAEKYLNQLNRSPSEPPAAPPKTDAYHPPMHPWRRYFARTLDYNLYLLPLELLTLLCFHINPGSNSGRIITLICNALAYVLMLVLEPLLLHCFGTTAGKWLFGLRIINADGTKLTYEEGIQRTWGVIRRGYGFFIPIYRQYRLWDCYKLCMDGQEQDWDEFPYQRLYTIRDTKTWRGIAYFISATVLLFLGLWATDASALPPNRGDLTVAEFAENYNFIYRYYVNTEPHYLLDENGNWEEQPSPPGVFYVEFGDGMTPLQYTVDAQGNLTGFMMTDPKGDYIDVLLTDQYLMPTLAYLRAQPGGGAFSPSVSKLSRRLNTLDRGADFRTAGLHIVFSYEHLDEETLSYTFSVTKDPQP